MNIFTDRLHSTKFSTAIKEFYNFANKYSRKRFFLTLALILLSI